MLLGVVTRPHSGSHGVDAPTLPHPTASAPLAGLSPAPAADAAGRVKSRTKVLPSVAVPTRPPRNSRGPFPCPKLTSIVLVVAAEPVHAFPPPRPAPWAPDRGSCRPC